MKRKSAFLVICMFFVLCNAAFSSKDVSAWLNGNNALALHPDTVYKPDYQNTHLLRTTSRYYGTHDWIAECALDLVFRANPSHPFVQRLWANIRDMKTIFLFGTEAPDAAYKGIPIEFTCSDGLVRYDTSWTGHHSLRFHPVGTLSSADLAVWADKLAGMVQVSLMNKQCVKASFLLGAMCHFIADAVFYPHLIPYGTSSSSWEKLIKWRVNWYTSRKMFDWNYMDDGEGNYEVTSDSPFFTHYVARDEFDVYKPDFQSLGSGMGVGYLATWYAGYQVRFGDAIDCIPLEAPQPGFIDHPPPYTGWWKDAPWMETHTFNQFALDFTADKPELRWDDIAEYFGDDRMWLETLQFHLNVGVYYCAAVINSLLVHYTGCSSSVEEDWNRSAAKFTAEYAFCFLFAFMGNFALLYVFTNTAISTLASKLGVQNLVVPS